MKSKWIAAAFAGLVLAPCVLVAQAPPAGATGKCKDGTYTTSPTKSGACKGHKGVDTWLAASTTSGGTSASSTAAKPSSSSASTPAASSSSSTPAAKPTSSPSAAPAESSSSSKSASSKTPAPGGGPGMVWLNTSSKVYHCYGGADYGTTKAGKYMSEADAKAAGGRPAGGKACSK
jgi:Protein of unknown function (DUF3761)